MNALKNTFCKASNVEHANFCSFIPWDTLRPLRIEKLQLRIIGLEHGFITKEVYKIFKSASTLLCLSIGEPTNERLHRPMLFRLTAILRNFSSSGTTQIDNRE